MIQRDAKQEDDREITPTELAERVKRGGTLQLVDVREPREHAYARIDGSLLIPLRTLPGRSAELDREAETVVYCHHGVRSDDAVGFLRSQGFTNTRNLAGGIDRWSVDVDPTVPRY